MSTPNLLHRRVVTMPLSASRDLVPLDRPIRWCSAKSDGFDGCPYQAMPGDTLCAACRSRTPRLSPTGTTTDPEAAPMFTTADRLLLVTLIAAFLVFFAGLKGWI